MFYDSCFPFIPFQFLFPLHVPIPSTRVIQRVHIVLTPAAVRPQNNFSVNVAWTISNALVERWAGRTFCYFFGLRNRQALVTFMFSPLTNLIGNCYCFMARNRRRYEFSHFDLLSLPFT